MNTTNLGAGVLVAFIFAAPSPAVALERPLADAFPFGHLSCHARVLTAAERADKDRRIGTMALDRTASDVTAERDWAKREELDGSPIISATLRIRFRGQQVAHNAKLACARGDDGGLICVNATCPGGEVRIAGESQGKLTVSIGGKLKSGRFIRHYIHLDDSCEGRSGGPLVLAQAEDDHRFSLAPAPKEACR